MHFSNGERTEQKRKAVVVHRGARDAYQVAAALAEADLLDSLVTDLYWPADRSWASSLARRLPSTLSSQLHARNARELPSRLVSQALLTGLLSFGLEKLSAVPFAWRQRATRWTDRTLGRSAGRRATSRDALLLSYSYYGYDAFRSHGKPGILFQLHPHPASVRKILKRELEEHPECADSLNKEWELTLADDDFHRLIEETELASHFLAASSFTRQTLVENGAASNAVTVVPYGVDLKRFQPAPYRQISAGNRPLQLLFVGTINQRKGIRYLLDALRQFDQKHVRLTVCGRAVDDLAIFRAFGSQVDVRPSVSLSELQQAYQCADLFVFPSVVEGFAQVLLESLASGLPILSTTHTAAPDLIDNGIQGFVVEPRRPDLLAERIDWALRHRTELDDMRVAARARAEQFTWQRFRAGIVSAVREFETKSAVGAANRDLFAPVSHYV